MPEERSHTIMFGSPRIRTKALADLCRRLSMSLGAGVDVRRIVAQEAARAAGMGARHRLQAVSDGVQAGNSLHESLQAADDYFPPMFIEMVQLGEQTGRLSETFALLADHYEGRVRLARTFLAALVWPILELSIALVVVGLLIWIQGVLGSAGGTKIDLLGIGLTGTRGLVIYLVYLAAIGFGIYLFIRALRRGALWTRPLQRLALRVPGLGKPLRVVCMARLAWAMHLTFSTGMEVRRALRLSLRSAQNALFSDQIRPIEQALDAGEPLADAFRQTGAFPDEFLDTLQVAEQSGRLTEAMAHLSEQYRHQAEAAMRVLAVIGGFVVYGIIALFIIALIFTLASSYIGTIYSYTKM